ncbi:MAG: small basic protein [Candidatus Omnitrophica bacterium]|nr:small basic protein [Candidatus Omnitrophota bacterium]
MSQHPSLKATGNQKQRSVLNRLERIKHLKDKELWKNAMSIFGLPKVKTLKIKAGKRKGPAEEKEQTATETQKPTQ